MEGNGQANGAIRFGVFEVEPRTGELRKAGSRIRVQDQPFKVLLALLERPGEVVTREELQERIWPAESFGDFDHAVNVAIAKLRTALGDSAESPRYIETLHRRGYRFVFPVTSPAGQEAGIAMESEREARNSSEASLRSSVAVAAREHKFGAAATIVVALLLAASSYGLYSFLHRAPALPFQNFNITQVTRTGDVREAAISPDGKYILSARRVDGKESLWLRNVPTSSDTQVIASSFAVYQGLAFSPNGNYIYFCKASDQSETSFNLFRAPVLGGTPQQIASDMNIDFGFSPDGKRIAYFRSNSPVTGEFRFLSADSDGSNEKVLFIEKGLSSGGSPAWSPDGRKIAYVAVGGKEIKLFDTASGKTTTLAAFKDRGFLEMHWLPDGHGLAVVYALAPGYAQNQIAFISYPDGAFHAITRDTSNYDTLTLSSEGETMATVQSKTIATPYLFPGSGLKDASPTAVPLQISHIEYMDWAGDSELLVSDGVSLFRVGVDGGNRTTLASDANRWINAATRCGDNYFALSWRGHNNTNVAVENAIWRFDSDGSKPVQLTASGYAPSLSCSPDGKTVYYFDLIADRIMQVSIDGGSPEIVPGTDIPKESVVGSFIRFSPDGKQMPFLSEDGSGHETIYIVNLNAGVNPPRRSLTPDPRFSGFVEFTPDGKALAYSITENGVQNLWIQPLDGSPGRQITNFKSGTSELVGWSPDGKTFATLRFSTQSDVVLLRDTATASQ